LLGPTASEDYYWRPWWNARFERLGCRVHVRGRSTVRKRGVVYRRRSVRRHKCSPLLTGIVREDRLAGERSKTARFAELGSGQKGLKIDCCDGRHFLLPSWDIQHLSWE